MRTSLRWTGFILVALFCSVSVATAGEEVTTKAATKDPCCFENARYSGTCQVTPGDGETCGDILAYLNNPNSVGKNYCGNTKVRGGWHKVSCDAEKTSAGTGVAPVQQTRE